jgi:hypothetical protein
MKSESSTTWWALSFIVSNAAEERVSNVLVVLPRTFDQTEGVGMRMAKNARWRIAALSVVSLAGLGLIGIAAGPASAGSADVTAGAGGTQAGPAVVQHVKTHDYTAFLSGCCEYSWDVSSNHTASSSIVPPDGFVGTWTWSKHGKTITFQETNGAGCTWTAKKTKTGYNTEAHQGLAVCSGTDYTWYATKGAPPG